MVAVASHVLAIAWVLCLLSVLVSVSGEGVSATVYVEPNGSASCLGEYGSVDCPCTTLLDALNLAFKEPSGLVRVLLNPGNYIGTSNSELVLNSSVVSVSIEYRLSPAFAHFSNNPLDPETSVLQLGSFPPLGSPKSPKQTPRPPSKVFSLTTATSHQVVGTFSPL